MRIVDIDNLPRHGGRGGLVYWKDIEEQATEITLCKDCIHWSDEFHWCNIRDSYGWDYKPDDYCSYGEREEE